MCRGAVFEQIHDKTFAFPRNSHQNLGFPTQTPRSQSDRINMKLSKTGSIGTTAKHDANHSNNHPITKSQLDDGGRGMSGKE
jgi:hypothetical protein